MEWCTGNIEDFNMSKPCPVGGLDGGFGFGVYRTVLSARTSGVDWKGNLERKGK
jgi:hypothetical protein